MGGLRRSADDGVAIREAPCVSCHVRLLLQETEIRSPRGMPVTFAYAIRECRP